MVEFPDRISTIRLGPALAAACVTTFFAWRCYNSAVSSSITYDEDIFLNCGINYWMTGDDRDLWALGVPRLPHLLSALPPYLSALWMGLDLLPRPDSSPDPVSDLVASAPAWMLVPARCVAIVWGLGLLFAVYWGVARRRGDRVGVCAMAVASLIPEVLAHSSLATSDMPCAAASSIAIILICRYGEQPDMERLLVASLSIGFAWSTRHSAILLLPVAWAVIIWSIIARSGTSESRLARVAEAAFHILILTSLAFSLLWAGDGLKLVDPADPGVPPLPAGLLRSMPVPNSLASLVFQLEHQSQGHLNYYCGQISDRGHPSYFPLAFILKTPVGLLALAAIAAPMSSPRNIQGIATAGYASMSACILIFSNINIGIRYCLIFYPLCAILVARLYEAHALRDRIRGPLTIAASLWLVMASLLCHGRFLSSFNEVGGGPAAGHLYLADSNIDWGQDVGALTRYLKRHGIRDVTVNVFCPRSAASDWPVPGGPAEQNPRRDRRRLLLMDDGTAIAVPTRYYAVSINRLIGLYGGKNLSWLHTRHLVARIGDSIFLFDLDRSAESCTAG